MPTHLHSTNTVVCLALCHGTKSSPCCGLAENLVPDSSPTCREREGKGCYSVLSSGGPPYTPYCDEVSMGGAAIVKAWWTVDRLHTSEHDRLIGHPHLVS